jgi:hypothetical protein
MEALSMKNFIMFVFSLVLLLALFGCQSGKGNELIKVTISKASGFGQVNDDSLATYEDASTLSVFNEVITTASKQSGIVDVAAPDYTFQVFFENGEREGYHLWVGEKGRKSMIMKTNDTHTVYLVSEELTNKLIEIIPNN